MNKQQLIDFETEIMKEYEAGYIRSPVHFSRGNEDQLIEIFKEVRPQDWVFSTHRSHYHALLKSNDSEWVRSEIMANRSIHLNSQKYRFFTSAIVGGICPIALGTALGIKLKGLEDRVWCFLGDMASTMGVFSECLRYAKGFNLPITYVVEDNGLSVYTPTQEVWGTKNQGNLAKFVHYKYERQCPHYGTGKPISFPQEKLKSQSGSF